MKTSLFIIPQPPTRSAFERNLNASANSRKPNVTFSLVNQYPEFGITDKYLG